MLNRMTPYISSFLLLLFFQIILIAPRFTIPLAILILVIVFLSIWQLNNQNILSKNFWHFLGLSILSVISSTLLLLFLESLIIKEILIFGIVVLNFILQKSIFTFIHEPEKYQPYSLENIYHYTGLVINFLFYTSFFSFIVYFGFSYWLLTIPVFALTFLLTYLSFWASKLNFHQTKIYILIISLMMSELFLAVRFLPMSYFVNAFIMIAIYYIISNISRDYLKNIFNLKRLRLYLATSLTLIILILITARWA